MYRDMKKRASLVVRKHYIALVFLCLIGAFYGTEYKSSVLLFSDSTGTEMRETKFIGSVTSSDIVLDLMNGDLIGADEKAQENLDVYAEQEDTTDTVLGRTQGVFAHAVNQITSGMFAVKIAQTVYTIVKSDSIASMVLALIGLGGFAIFWIFITNTLQVVIHRFFLESRTYEKLHMRSALYLNASRCWGKAAKTMMMKSMFHLLWSFTIVGLFVKYFSYYLVTFIVAENPDLGWKRSIDLSKRMMDGHKMEAFKLELSMFGWHILSALTGGISSLLWFNSYHTAVVAEFYAKIREEAQERQLDDSIMLNDRYLYMVAEEDVMNIAYGDIVKEIQYVQEHPVQLTKTQERFADWLGIWVGSTKNKNIYQEISGRKSQIEKDKDIMNGNAYPERLAPLYIPERKELAYKMTWNRVYSLWSLLAMFFTFSFVGWVWEVILTLINQGVFVNRGTLSGPWLPIYGFGGVLALTLLARFRQRQTLTFTLSIVMSGVIEYFTSYFLEKFYGLRWWDYTGYFLNLNGRICAEGLLVFGVGCVLVIYFVAPMFDMWLAKQNPNVTKCSVIILVILFILDGVTSFTNPNSGDGITNNEAGKNKESTVVIE